ncbi:hypothetical protein [Bradyrhizobium liaoningense]
MQLEAPQRSRGLAVAVKPERRPSRIDRLGLWFSKSSMIDGLWIGTTESKPYPALRRVEEALQLIKRHDTLNYSRISRNLNRIWVHLLPSAQAHYDRSLNACALDERYVLNETMTPERIASTIVHEATHARLDGWGIIYEESSRYRIEAACLRRELSFLKKLPDTGLMQEEIVRTLEWCESDETYLTDASFRSRECQGQIDTLRYLNAPDWLIQFAMWLIRRRRSRYPPHKRLCLCEERSGEASRLFPGKILGFFSEPSHRAALRAIRWLANAKFVERSRTTLSVVIPREGGESSTPPLLG